jgi:hypothetical protein
MLYALKYLAKQNLLYNNFTTKHILVTKEGFKLNKSWHLSF